MNTLLGKGLEGPPIDGPLESIRAQRLPLACVFLDDIGYVDVVCSDLGVWVRLGLLLWFKEEEREARVSEKKPFKKVVSEPRQSESGARLQLRWHLIGRSSPLKVNSSLQAPP